jgi:hypothetical protein
MAEGTITYLDEFHPDEVIYHRSRTIEVWAHLDSRAEIQHLPSVVEMQHGVYAQEYDPETGTFEETLDITFIITENGVEVVT